MRAFLLVLDSLGIGEAPDAAAYGDVGADTLGHVAQACLGRKADGAGSTGGGLAVPNLAAIGLVHAARAAGNGALPIRSPDQPAGCYGYAAEVSRGKDTPSGHWEIAGLPVTFDWGYFPATASCFPASLIRELVEVANLPGVLGECHASGTAILDTLGAEHVRSGKPIIYTSADSVLQIAAHETAFGLERLYDLCVTARGLVDAFNIGRVIARPFVGDSERGFERTSNRRDYVTPPHAPTLLDVARAAGREVVAIGKVADIFGHRGVSRVVKAGKNSEVGQAVLNALEEAPDGALVIANFNDFDTVYGHRRDPAGYAAALERFDHLLGRIRASLRAGDLLVLTADHGCDPTMPGSDHTREYVPVLFAGSSVIPGAAGRRETFADVGQSIAAHLELPALAHGTSCLSL